MRHKHFIKVGLPSRGVKVEYEWLKQDSVAHLAELKEASVQYKIEGKKQMTSSSSE